MPQTCASYLSHFAFAVDTVDDSTYANIKNLLQGYFSTIKTSFFAILIDGVRVDQQPGLKTLWSSRPVEETVSILDDNGDYRGIRTFSYDKDLPLWITAEDEGLLARPDAVLKDAWSPYAELPSYLDRGDTEAKTGVIVPLRYGGRVFGVMILEFGHCFECTPAAKQELITVVDAISRIVWLHETTKNQLDDTQSAFRQLEELFKSNCRPLTKPTVFFASSTHADQNVVARIRKVLEEFGENFDTNYWKNHSESGAINAKILNAIASSQHGICYLSERTGDEGEGALPYRDNPNVLFEAGMLHALTNDPAAEPTGWIPIRDDQQFSGPPPFDIAGERMVLVPRIGPQSFNEDAFEVSLRKAICAILPGDR